MEFPLGFSIYLGPYQPFLERSLFDEVKDLRQRDPLTPLVVLVPNRLLVRLADDLLARDGKMVEAVEAMGPSTAAEEGTPVEFPLNVFGL